MLSLSLNVPFRLVLSHELRICVKLWIRRCRRLKVESVLSLRFRLGNVDRAGDVLWVEVIHKSCILSCVFEAKLLTFSSWVRQSDGVIDGSSRCGLGIVLLLQAAMADGRVAVF